RREQAKGGYRIIVYLKGVGVGFLFLLLIPMYVKAESPSIQQQIDEAKPGDSLELQEGKYEENIIINKPIHLIGLEDVMLTQEKFSPVITIRSEDVTI